MDRNGRRNRQRGAQQPVIDRIARGAPAKDVLGTLCANVERLVGRGVRCAVHLLDAKGVRIVEVIAPSLKGRCEHRGAVAVGPAAGTSAAAAFLRRQVVSEQIDEDPVAPVDGTGTMRELGIRAVCATPILSESNAVLGVLSLYYPQPGAPLAAEAEAIEWAKRLASIALGHERALSALKASEAKYRSFLDNLRDGVFITQEGIVVYANPAMALLTGRSAADLLGGDFNGMLDPADSAQIRERARRRARGERVPSECELRITRTDGERRFMRLNEAAITWNAAPVLLATLTDITERRLAEQEVRRLNVELEERVEERTRELASANAQLEAFSCSVSHDLRAPVRAISGFCSILVQEHGERLGREARQHLERVQRAAQRMGEMIEGLLALARIARAAPQFGRVDLSAIAQAELHQLAESQPGRRVDVEVRANLNAWGDERMLRAVLDNLLGNAWKFTAKAPAPRIEVGEIARDGERVFFVRDNGAGFDMRYADKLFGLFQRLHSNEDFEGTGVGLATAQRIIACHGGRIWAESEMGRGAAFFFTLAAPGAPAG